jgi:hypothetical protein
MDSSTQLWLFHLSTIGGAGPVGSACRNGKNDGGRSKSTVLTGALALGYPSRPALFLLRAALKHAISIASDLQGMGNTPDLVGRESVVNK